MAVLAGRADNVWDESYLERFRQLQTNEEQQNSIKKYFNVSRQRLLNYRHMECGV